VTPAGDQDPGLAVNCDPTCAVPLTVAVPAVNAPGWTVTGTDVTLLDVYPDSEPVTRTDTDPPASPADRVYVEEVAPEIAAPSRSHW
jgi:hypothetical protein